MDLRKITCVVLTGGGGARLRPLTARRSKSMIPFVGRPLIDHVLHELARQGLTDIIVSNRGFDGDIAAHVGDGRIAGVRARYGAEIGSPGSAAIVRALLQQRDGAISDPFIVVYGDSLLSIDCRAMVQTHARHDALATIAAHRPSFESFLAGDPRIEHDHTSARTNYGVMEVPAHSRITRFEEKPLLSDISKHFENPWANAAVYVLDKTAFLALSSNARDFGAEYFQRMIAQGATCVAFDIYPGFRIDLGTLANYVATSLDVLRGSIAIHMALPLIGDRTWIASNSEIHESADLFAPVVICGGSKIGPGVVVSESVIGEDVELSEGSLVTSSILFPGCTIGPHAKVTNAILGYQCCVGADTGVPAGSVFGDDCVIGAFSFRAITPEREKGKSD